MERTPEDPHVVVGVDGSEPSILALRLAAKLAPALGAEVHAVACWDYPRMYEEYLLPDMTIFGKGAQKRLDEAIHEAFGDETPPGFTSTIIRGHPSTVLVEAAARAQMLVVGRRGHGGLRGLHLGSVSNACVARAVCPVVVVHDDGKAEPHHRWRDRYRENRPLEPYDLI
ncbi:MULTISPECIES: universal stress protein [unclassified Arthrobacter]|uniref:universal stress protein n=1 Tax=unclassified Arthrobacter TaxID=235627 RepID=UPI0004649F68|nr:MULTISPECIES: universal stress protein [unclassified Arthrobacter]PVE19232.1 universal stress protein UspA [Arthrobacter sp. Bz4]